MDVSIEPVYLQADWLIERGAIVPLSEPFEIFNFDLQNMDDFDLDEAIQGD